MMILRTKVSAAVLVAVATPPPPERLLNGTFQVRHGFHDAPRQRRHVEHAPQLHENLKMCDMSQARNPAHRGGHGIHGAARQRRHACHAAQRPTSQSLVHSCMADTAPFFLLFRFAHRLHFQGFTSTRLGHVAVGNGMRGGIPRHALQRSHEGVVQSAR